MLIHFGSQLQRPKAIRVYVNQEKEAARRRKTERAGFAIHKTEGMYNSTMVESVVDLVHLLIRKCQPIQGASYY